MSAATSRCSVLRKLRPLIAPLIVAMLTGAFLWWQLPHQPRWKRECPRLDEPIACSPDGQAFTFGYLPHVYDIRTGRQLPYVRQALPDDADNIRFCPDGTLLYLTAERNPHPTADFDPDFPECSCADQEAVAGILQLRRGSRTEERRIIHGPNHSLRVHQCRHSMYSLKSGKGASNSAAM